MTDRSQDTIVIKGKDLGVRSVVLDWSIDLMTLHMTGEENLQLELTSQQAEKLREAWNQ